MNFIDEIYSNPSTKNYRTNEKLSYGIAEIWSIDLKDVSDYKSAIGSRYIVITIASFSK